MLAKVSQLLRQPVKQKPQPLIALDGHSLTLEKLSLLGSGQSKV